MSLGHFPDLKSARFRAEKLKSVRDFFSHRQVLEVDVPILSRGISLDCHIDPFSTEFFPLGIPGSNKSETYYLQSSPEPHLKRLLCAGYPDLYALGHSFRNGEKGHHHNPEFTMLEWYRKGFSLEDLMREVADLLQLIAGSREVIHLTYIQAFEKYLGFDPLAQAADFFVGKGFRDRILKIISLPENLPLQTGRKVPVGHIVSVDKKVPIGEKISAGLEFSTRTDALNFLLSHFIENQFSDDALTFLSLFPSDQAAQAQVLPQNPHLAYRFEVYGGGMELGNGYLELKDAGEYRSRFESENSKRSQYGKPTLPLDENLLTAIETGLPDCAGVAMGFDRILLLAHAQKDIQSLLNFPWESC